MTEFYTNIENYKGKLLYRGYDNGKSISRKIDYKPCLFVPATKSSEFTPYKSLYGSSLARIDFDSIYEAKDYIRQYSEVEGFEIHGQTDFKYSYLADTFSNDIDFKLQDIEIYDIDIETCSENGFPDILTANEEILLITVHMKKRNVYVTFVNNMYGTDYPEMMDKIVKYVDCANEKSLLTKFLNFWKNSPPDIVTGWHIEGFDIPYLVNRITRILGKEEVKHLSPWGIINEKNFTNEMGQQKVSYSFLGISILDYLEVYKKFTYVNRESYKLDYIASVELNEQKLSYDEYENMHSFYKADFKKFIAYNIHDVWLVNKLEAKLKLIELIITLAYAARINFQDVFSPVRMWDTIIFNELWKENTIIPPSQGGSKREQFAGAHVKEPLAGKHKWVVSLDAASLYPHLMIQYNIGPETFVDTVNVTVNQLLEHQYDTTEEKEKGYILAGNGARYRKDKSGILARMMQKFYDDRSRYKKKMLEIEKLLEKDKSNIELQNERAKYYNFQLATKIALNSAYGACGNPGFRYYDLINAEAVTISGQLSIKYAEKVVNEYLNKLLKTDSVDYVIYVDTDSVVGDSTITVNGKSYTIEEYYNSLPNDFIKFDDFNKDYVKSVNTGDTTLSFNKKKKNIEEKQIKYVMKHTVNKEMFKIKSKTGKEVIVTEDHSIIVLDVTNNEIKDISPKNLNKNIHKIINIVRYTDTDNRLKNEKGLQN